MNTRIDLFCQWSDEDGVGFFLGHNKMKQENSINMLMKISMIPPDNVIKGTQFGPEYNNQDLKAAGILTIPMLAMEPLELFPRIFLFVNALFELRTPKGTFTVMNDQSILSVLQEEYTINDLLTQIKNNKIQYQLTIVDGAKMINSDDINNSPVYIKINKGIYFKNAAAYNVSGPSPNNKTKYHFYGEYNNSTKRIKFDAGDKQVDYDRKVTEWICHKMAKSNPYDVWLKMLTINKDRAKKKGYPKEKVEYLKSMLSWSLNSYVMLQNAIGKTDDIPKLSYLDLEYADRELTLFRV